MLDTSSCRAHGGGEQLGLELDSGAWTRTTRLRLVPVPAEDTVVGKEKRREAGPERTDKRRTCELAQVRIVKRTWFWGEDGCLCPCMLTLLKKYQAVLLLGGCFRFAFAARPAGVLTFDRF